MYWLNNGQTSKIYQQFLSSKNRPFCQTDMFSLTAQELEKSYKKQYC
jgi:hypothetical protein